MAVYVPELRVTLTQNVACFHLINIRHSSPVVSHLILACQTGAQISRETITSHLFCFWFRSCVRNVSVCALNPNRFVLQLH
jgi:hypothetical protein